MSFVLDNSIALAWCFESEQTTEIMALLDRVTDFGAVAPQLARRHGLTSYDAAYLELAGRLALPLATNDTALKAAARTDAIPLLPAD